MQLWSTKTGEQIVCFYHAEKPVFTLDCKYLLYIDSGQTLITYCLSRMAPMRYLACQAEQLIVLPVKHRLVLMTSGASTSCPCVTLWDFHEGRQLVSLAGVAAGGIRDVSKDGELAVDASLQMFDLNTGALKSRVDDNLSGDKDLSFVRLTYDGRYVVWVDKFSVKVGRVSDGTLVAHTCTHERPTSLCTLDCGYVLIVGREDGRILMMSLLANCQQSHALVCRPHTAEERCTIIHGRQVCSDSVKSGFDIMYQCSAHPVRDSELLRASESIRSTLAHRAKAPLLSTATTKVTDATTDKFRRSYSQMTPIGDYLQMMPIGDLHEGGALTGASSYHDLVVSPSPLQSPDAAHRRSVDELRSEADTLIERRSISVTDIRAICTLKRDATPPTANSTSPGTADPPARLPRHKFLGYFFGATSRSRRKKQRRRAAANTDSRDRMPSV